VEFVVGPRGAPWLLVGINERGWQRVMRLQSDDYRTLPVADLPQGLVSVPVVSPDGNWVAFRFSGPSQPMCIGVMDLAQERIHWRGPSPVTGITPDLLQATSFDGSPVHFWVYLPTGPVPQGGWPVVIYLHGGPESQERPIFRQRFSALIASGCAVVAPNLRGSTGYGRQFQLQIRRNWGGPDWADLQAVVHSLRLDGRLNTDRMALLGESYGGYLSLWAGVQQPSWWKAIACIQGPSDLVDLVLQQSPEWRAIAESQIGDPVRDCDRLKAHSPIHYVDRLTAPLLVVHGMEDVRVPFAQSLRLVESLRALERDVTPLFIPGEGHDLLFPELDDKVCAFLCSHLGCTPVAVHDALRKL
jgi:dipeptidyl aminopeptidase/acylaminoacyl peptidase